MRLFNRLRDNRGQAMLALVSILAVIMLMGTAAVTLATGAKTEATAEENRAKALYIAEAGVEMALDYLQNDLLYYDRQYLNDMFPRFVRTNEEYQGGLIEEAKVQWSGQGDDYLITSSARYPKEGAMQAFRKVTVRIRVQENAFLTFGGPGIKSDTNVRVNSLASVKGGAIVARTGDVLMGGAVDSNGGGIYAGHDVQWTSLVGSSGQGEIKAGGDVSLSGILGGWTGTIWAGGDIDDVLLQLGGIESYDHCDEIPGFPIPEFPAVDKNSAWYEAIKRQALDEDRYYDDAKSFYHDNCNITTFLGIPVSATLDLDSLSVVNGPLSISSEGFRDAGCAALFMGVDCDNPATIVADSIVFSGAKISILGLGLLGVDVSGVRAPLGLFAVNGGVNYDGALLSLGGGGKLCVMANGPFTYNAALDITGSTFDWVAAKGNVNVSGLIKFNFAEDSIPPGTPVGYEIISWKEE